MSAESASAEIVLKYGMPAGTDLLRAMLELAYHYGKVDAGNEIARALREAPAMRSKP